MTAAARQQKRRERVRLGLTVVQCELSFDDIDTLVEVGVLEAWCDKDPVAIAAALHRLIAHAQAPSRVTAHDFDL